MAASDLAKARKQLNAVRTLMKQRRLLPAVQHLYDALGTMLSTSLIMNERTELEEMIAGAVDWISNDTEIRKIFPLLILYTPGKELELYETTQELLNSLQQHATAELAGEMESLTAKRHDLMLEARNCLLVKNLDRAKELHTKVVHLFGEEYDLLAEIGEDYLTNGYYEEAFEYLSKALELKPDSIHLYNRVAIALRKMGRFDLGEKYYRQALKITGPDAGLLFNLGRLYVDSQNWAKAEEVARLLLKTNPDFAEGAKLLAYVQKKQQTAT